MRPQKVQDEDVMISLVNVFRTNGYDGASLGELAESTGLKKASLYHRFPNGKEAMAAAVMQHIDEWVARNIFQKLLDESESPVQRLLDGLHGIRTLYDDGKEACILRAMSQGAGLELFDQQIKSGMTGWIDAFAKLGLAFGLSEPEARAVSVQTLISLQGSLVVSKGLGDPSVFAQTVKNIERTYRSI